jgi:4-amino-4-deoxy-L-arabinose transferase-like glycosyltransferase
VSTTLFNAATRVDAEPVSSSQRRPFLSRRSQFVFLLLIWAVVFFGSLFQPAVLDDADGTHANAARWMVEHQDYVTLHVDGIRYLEKAPLPYWLVATSFKLFGYNAFATHLPFALATLGTALLAFAWGGRAFGERAGFYAAVMILTIVGEFLFTRMMIPEVLISLMLSAALYCFAQALERPHATAKYWYAIYALMALAVLTKGLIGVVFFVGPALLYLLITGEWRRWREFRLLSGTLLFVLIAAPWHVLAARRNPGFLWFYFVNEHFLRFIGKRFPKDYNKLPAALYWSLHIVWLFPWSLLLPLTVRRVWKRLAVLRRNRTQLGFANRSVLLSALQALTVLLFFAVSTNQEYYTFPAYFPLVLLTGMALADAEERPRLRRWVEGAYAVLLSLGLLVASLLVIGLWSSRHLAYVADIGTVLAERGVGDYTLSMSHFFDLTGASFAALRLPAVIAAVSFAIGPIIAFVLRRRERGTASMLAVALAMVGFLSAAHLALVRFEPFLSSVKLANAFNRSAAPLDELLVYGDQSYASSLIFYSGRQALLVNGKTTSLLWGSRYPDAPDIFLDDAALLRHWRSDRRMFLFVGTGEREKVRQLLGALQPYEIAECSGKMLIANH